MPVSLAGCLNLAALAPHWHWQALRVLRLGKLDSDRDLHSGSESVCGTGTTGTVTAPHSAAWHWQAGMYYSKQSLALPMARRRLRVGVYLLLLVGLRLGGIRVVTVTATGSGTALARLGVSP